MGAPCTLKRFNSNMVQLRVYITMFEAYTKKSFNSNMVQLRGSLHTMKILSIACFNSNMVQLRVLSFVDHLSTSKQFQFQYGTIKSADVDALSNKES